MCTSVGLLELRAVWEPPPSAALDEAVWQAWVARGRAQDRRDSAARVKTVKCGAIAALLAAGLWTLPVPYELVVRFIVAAAAVAVMFHAFHTRHYAFASVFGAVALLYNPVAPVFSFSGDWQRALLLASTLPFVASLAWLNVRRAHND